MSILTGGIAVSEERDSGKRDWWRWRGFIAFGSVLLAAAVFVLLRRDLFAAMLTLIVLSGALLATSPFWLFGGWLIQCWWRRRKIRYLIPAPLVLAPALILVPILLYMAVSLTRQNGLLAGQDRYVVLIVVDGGSFERALELFEEAAGGDMEHYRERINRAFPNISQRFVGEGAYTLNGVTIWPSSSVPAHTSIITGACAGKHGIAG